jgi:hypothetical protein
VPVRVPDPVATPARGAKCWAKGKPSPIPGPKQDEYPFCNAFDTRIFASVESEVKKAYVITEAPSKLVVDFGCDLANDDVAEVWFEDGSGHGGSLGLVRMVVGEDKVDVRVLDSSHYYGAGLALKRGSIDRKVFDTWLARARVAMLAKPHLIRLVDPKGPASIGSMSGSSNDFHLRLTIVDRAGHRTDRGFTGYESTGEQDDIIPMRLATEPLQVVLEKMKVTDEVATDEDRRFFTARFADTMADKPYWWVGERYVANAATLGTIDAMPALLATLRAPAGASEDRAREAALVAIAAITGWDPTLDDTGKERPVADAVKAALEECVLPGPS